MGCRHLTASELWQVTAEEVRLTKELEAAVAKATKAEAGEREAMAKLAELEEGTEWLKKKELDELEKRLTEDFETKQKQELESLEAKDQELNNEVSTVSTVQKAVDGLRE